MVATLTTKWRAPPLPGPLHTPQRAAPRHFLFRRWSVPRSDARRNYARILAVAEDEVAAHGADASLEQIARTAGVGSAAVRRHFPSRRELLEAVFRQQVDALAALARELAEAPDARAA